MHFITSRSPFPNKQFVLKRLPLQEHLKCHQIKINTIAQSLYQQFNSVTTVIKVWRESNHLESFPQISRSSGQFHQDNSWKKKLKGFYPSYDVWNKLYNFFFYFEEVYTEDGIKQKSVWWIYTATLMIISNI